MERRRVGASLVLQVVGIGGPWEGARGLTRGLTRGLGSALHQAVGKVCRAQISRQTTCRCPNLCPA